MRRLASSPRLVVSLLCVLVLAGCADRPPTTGARPGGVTGHAGKPAHGSIASKRSGLDKARPTPRETATVDPLVSPVFTPLGTVVSVDRDAQFVIVSFLDATLPPLGARMSVFRDEEKIAELRITGPQRNLQVVADILTGDCRPGDKVRIAVAADVSPR